MPAPDQHRHPSTASTHDDGKRPLGGPGSIAVRDVTATQRWRNGQSGFIRPDDCFRAGDYSAEVVDDRTARSFVVAHHYSGSFPASILNVGLFRAGRRTPLGILVFSVPIQPKAAAAYGAADAAFCDLGRLVLLDEAPFNSETWLVAQGLRHLASEKRTAEGAPRYAVVLAYSDPVERIDASGRIVTPGHVGHVFGPAGGALYVGRGTPRSLWLTRSGTILSPRSLSKIRTDDRGAAAAYRTMLAHGAPPIAHGEGAAAYIERALAEGPFRRMRHPGNHVYAFMAAGSQRQRRRLRQTMNRHNTANTDLPYLPYPAREIDDAPSG